MIIEHRFHRAIIGQKGEKIKEIRDKFPEVKAYHNLLDVECKVFDQKIKLFFSFLLGYHQLP